MAGANPPARAALILLLLIELWLYTGSVDKFFNHDSLFYLIHAPRSLEDLQTILFAPDSAKQYRPLSLAFMGLMVPIFGLDPRLYHWIPVVLHLLNTLLFYRLARRVLSDSLSAVAAVGFWGLHSVVAWITYDTTCISDLLLATFFLTALILAVDGQERNSWLPMGGSLLLFVCALLTKETAITFPLALLVTLNLADLQRSGVHASTAKVLASLKKALPLTSVALILALAHTTLLLYWLKTGLLYTQGSNAAYDINPWTHLAAKMKYLYWALNLPDPLHIPRANTARLLALILIGAFLLLWVVDFLMRKGKLLLIEWSGLIWFAGLSAPALMLSNRLAKWYLYVPLLGLGLAFGSMAGRLRNRLPGVRAWVANPAIWSVFVLPFLFSSVVQSRSYLVSSDAVYASNTLESCLKGFQHANPALPPNVTLFMLPLADFEKNVADLLKAPPIGDGQLFELYYPGSQVHLLFADKGDTLPENYFRRDDFRIVQYLLGRLNDVTGYYKGRRRDTSALRLIRNLESVQAKVSHDEFYPNYDRFLTPSGAPIFFPTPGREIFTQIGGSTASIRLDEVPPGSALRFDTAWMFSIGDGAWAELSIRSAGKESLLYKEYMKPIPERENLPWKEVQLDLAPYAERKVELILKCYNDPGKTTVADWLSWRDMVIEYPQTETSRQLVSPKADANSRKAERKAPPAS